MNAKIPITLVLILFVPFISFAQNNDSTSTHLNEATVTGTRNIAKIDARFLTYTLTEINRTEIEKPLRTITPSAAFGASAGTFHN